MNDRCSFPGCPEERIDGMLFGRDCGHQNAWICGRIVRLSDGTFAGTAGPRPRWLARQDDPEAEGATMGLNGKDLTGWAGSALA